MKKLFAVSLLAAAALASARSPSDDCTDPSNASLGACTAPASEGLAAVNVGGKWGFVGVDGQMKVPPKFNAVGAFSQGRAAASEDGFLWGYIDKQGHWLLQPRFFGATAFSEDRAFARDEHGAWHLIGLDGQFIAALSGGAEPLPYDPTGASLMVQGRAAVQLPPDRLLASQHGVTPLPLGAVAADQPREGLIRAALDEGVGKFGYLDLQGKWAIEPQYVRASSFMRGYAAVSVDVLSSWLINHKGEKLVDLGAAVVSEYHGYWGVWRDGEMHFLHPDGTPAAFDRETLKAAIGAAGEALEAHYDVRAMPPIAPGAPLALLQPKEGVKKPLGLIDPQGRIVFNEEWLSFPRGEYSLELPLVVETLGGYGAINGKGEWVVQPHYDHVGLFEQGRARIWAGENAGWAFASGKVLLPPPGIRWKQVHDDMTATFEGRDRREGVMSMQTGDVIWESQGRVYEISDSGKTYSEEVDDLEGVRKADGSWLLRPECERLEHLTGDTWLCRDEERRRYLIDAQGGKTPIRSTTKTSHGWLLHGMDRSGVLFYGREPVWFNRVLWYSREDTHSTEFVNEEALVVQQRGKNYAIVDAQGRTVSTHKAEALSRLAVRPHSLLLQHEESVEILGGTSPRAWPGSLMGDMHAGIEGFVTAERKEDDRLETLVRQSDGKVRASVEGAWEAVSPRWLARWRREDTDFMEFHELGTGRRHKTKYPTAHAIGANAIAVRDESEQWGWIDNDLKPVVKPTYAELGRFSQGVVWVHALESLDLLDLRGKRLGRVSYECGEPRWVPGAGNKTPGC